jgi:tRNA(fMet)-specific endonuclease VapC
MGLILDTSAVIGLIERRSAEIEAIIRSDPIRPVVSILTIGELQHGVSGATASRERRRRQETLDLVAELPAVGLSLATAACFGQLSARMSRRVGVADRWIAATALSRSLTLVTEDRDLAEALHGCEVPGRGAVDVVHASA